MDSPMRNRIILCSHKKRTPQFIRLITHKQLSVAVCFESSGLDLILRDPRQKGAVEVHMYAKTMSLSIWNQLFTGNNSEKSLEMSYFNKFFIHIILNIIRRGRLCKFSKQPWCLIETHTASVKDLQE